MSKVRHVLGISGGKDSAALAIYMKNRYPDLPIEYYNSDTGCELEETDEYIKNIKGYLGHIHMLAAKTAVDGDTPFDHFLKTSGGYLPSPQARWCTQKMKLQEFEKFVQDDYVISYVGIRGDENREGYVSTRPNIQTIFPFRKCIWSVDVITKALNNDNIESFANYYKEVATESIYESAESTLLLPITKTFFYSKKLNTLLDIDTVTFNKAIFEWLKTTDYPIGKLDSFPLVDNVDNLDKSAIFKILEDSGIGIPKYYTPIQFEIDGEIGYYNRSRSGCYFCFYQQKIEWVWLYEQHPDLYMKAMEYEKTGYTWIQGERLEDLILPERIRQIKLDYIKRTKTAQVKAKSPLLVNMFEDDDVNCANCFI